MVNTFYGEVLDSQNFLIRFLYAKIVKSLVLLAVKLL